MFGALLALAAGLGIAQGLRLPLPNPLDLIFARFRPLGGWMEAS